MKKGLRILTAGATLGLAPLGGCGTNKPPVFDSVTSHAETSVTLAKPDCPIYPLTAENTHDTLEPAVAKTIYWKVGKHSLQVTCIDARTNTIIDASKIGVSEVILSEYKKKYSTIGALALSLPAKCFDAYNFNTQYLTVTNQSELCAGELTATPLDGSAPQIK